MPLSEKTIKYPPEVYRDEYDMAYAAAKAYQNQVVKTLKEMFGDDMVKNEWDSATYYGHKNVYAPRVDIAIGPFNSYMDLDIGIDRTAVRKSHPLVKKLQERTSLVWNDFGRCFLAIEIVFSGSSKHIAGDFLNSTSTGAIGFVVAHRRIYNKVRRMSGYFYHLEGTERLHDKKGLRNLMVFSDENFLEFLWELKNPDKVKKLAIKNKYTITFRNHFRPVLFSIATFTMREKPQLGADMLNRLIAYGFDIDEVIEQHEVILTATRYTHPSTVVVYEIVTESKDRIRIMDIMDIRVSSKYRSKGIGTQMLKVFEKIGRQNKCQYICIELMAEHPRPDQPREPIEAQKRFFERNGFTIWSDKRAPFSEWVGKKSLTPTK